LNAAFVKAIPTLIGNFYAETPVQKVLRERREWVERCAMPKLQQAMESLEGLENVRTDGLTG
jgi:hypothetical protein